MNNTQICKLIEPTLHAMGLTLWACDLTQQKTQALLRVYIDRETGVTMDDCTQASREIGAILDVEDPIKNHYQLEVSSPGLDRALITKTHFEKYIGSFAKIKLRVLRENRKQFEAKIEKVIGDKIFFVIENEKTENEIIGVALGEIQKANLIVR